MIGPNRYITPTLTEPTHAKIECFQKYDTGMNIPRVGIHAQVFYVYSKGRLIIGRFLLDVTVTIAMKRRPCWCTKPILWELNSFPM